MKKLINTDAINSELTSGSRFFQRPSTPRPTEPQPIPAAPPPAPPERPARTVERVNERTPERAHVGPNARTPARRRAKRYSFEFYEDQIERVKRLALEDQLRGGTLNMSEIVREAIDRYLVHLGKATK